MEPRLSRVGFTLNGRPRVSMYRTSENYFHPSPFDLPPPDYRGYVQPTYNPTTFVAPENLIPTPDYARYEPQIDYELPKEEKISQGRPRLSNGRTQPAAETRTSARLDQIKEEPSNKNNVTEDHRLKPLVVDTGSVYPSQPIRETPTTKRPLLEQPSPYAVHSYLEDKDKLETDTFLNESTRSHIRSIGVPVLPPLGRDFVDNGGPSPAQNKAFIRHLENHRKFDTMKSLKSCKDCPLCQMMMGASGWQEEVEEKTRSRRPDVRDLFNESDFDWTLTRRSYTARAEGEISIGFREKVRVLKTENTHLLCEKTDGTMGWLPLNVVQREY